MAPVKTIQTRSNYVPWLTEETKKVQGDKVQAHKKAVQTDDVEDWRVFGSLRNQFTSRSRADKVAWEKERLDDGDDGAYSYAHYDPGILSAVLTRKFKLIEDWVNDNKLVINADKTHLLVLGPKKIENRRKEVEIQAGPYRIKPTECEKLLGAYLHKSMRWNWHIRDHNKSIMRQLTVRVNGLKRIAKTATFNTRLMIANGAVMSKVVYLISVWGGAQEYLLDILQVQQL